MEALRRQVEDLRREVDTAKKSRSWNSEDDQAMGEAGRGGSQDSVGRSGEANPGPSARGARRGMKPEGAAAAAMAVERGELEGAPRAGSAVLEAEFQRLRAKYEKAKGRIASLEEQASAARRAAVRARREFQVNFLGPTEGLPRSVCERSPVIRALLRSSS